MTCIIDDRMEMEWELPKIIQHSKTIIKDGTCMKFYNGTRPLYLETDTSGVGLGAGLL